MMEAQKKPGIFTRLTNTNYWNAAFVTTIKATYVLLKVYILLN